MSVVVLFGSETGTAEEVADKIAEVRVDRALIHIRRFRGSTPL